MENRNRFFIGALRRALVLFAAAGAFLAGGAEESAIERIQPFAKQKPKLTAESGAAEVLRACRAMLPERPVELEGALIVRSRKGITSSEYAYRLVMRREPDVALMSVKLMERESKEEIATATIARRGAGKATIKMAKRGGEEEDVEPGLGDRVLDTDVTWLDLTFDFLWWPHAEFEAEREGESVHGQKCMVITAKPGEAVEGVEAVRMWVDKKTGCLMQAEQIGDGGKAKRRLWGRRVKKFGERWMASELEVETAGARKRTKITVEELKEL